jgi:ketosteroid isomerase-like protein
MKIPYVRLGALASAAAGSLILASALAAHDFWLVPDVFRIEAGEVLQVRGQTSSAFPSSESALAVDRIGEAVVIDGRGREAVTEFSHAGTSLLLRHRPRRDGQHIVALVILPRAVRESPESFRNYLTVEGAPEILERLQREGGMPRDSITRQYSKYAKALVQVGAGGPSAYATTIGHPLEFVPLADPAAARPGSVLAIQLLLNGRPLANAKVHAGSVTPRDDAALDGLAGTEQHTELRTDADGRANVTIDRAGVWNVRALYLLPSGDGAEADWDTHWATLVFSVGEIGTSGNTAPGADSAAVVVAVDRFHRALTEGDSAAVAELLADDAIILETGGVETRSEYLAHHLHSDIAFARSVPRERSEIRVAVVGDVAWATSSSESRGRYRDRDVNSTGAELMVLRRMAGAWKIVAIHWSSRAAR